MRCWQLAQALVYLPSPSCTVCSQSTSRFATLTMTAMTSPSPEPRSPSRPNSPLSDANSMADTEPRRPTLAELQQRIRDIEIKQEEGIERLAAMRAAGFKMDCELRELRAALDRLNQVCEPAADSRLLITDIGNGQKQTPAYCKVGNSWLFMLDP